MKKKANWTTIHGGFECKKCGFKTQNMKSVSKHKCINLLNDG